MRKVGFIGIVALMLGIVAPVWAETQTIDATLGSSVSMTTAPTATVSGWALAGSGANTRSGGSMTISSNAPYTVTVVADKAKMTEYVTATALYVATAPKTLTNSLSVIPTLTSGTGVPVASLAVGTTAGTLATGSGLGTDSYSLTLSQTTVIGDAALPSGRTYHIVLTYTASSTL